MEHSICLLDLLFEDENDDCCPGQGKGNQAACLVASDSDIIMHHLDNMMTEAVIGEQEEEEVGEEEEEDKLHVSASCYSDNDDADHGSDDFIHPPLFLGGQDETVDKCDDDDKVIVGKQQQRTSARNRVAPSRFLFSCPSLSSSSSSVREGDGDDDDHDDRAANNKREGRNQMYRKKHRYTMTQKALLLNAFEDYCAHPEEWRQTKNNNARNKGISRKRKYPELVFTGMPRPNNPDHSGSAADTRGEGTDGRGRMAELSRLTGLSTVQASVFFVFVHILILPLDVMKLQID